VAAVEPIAGSGASGNFQGSPSIINPSAIGKPKEKMTLKPFDIKK